MKLSDRAVEILQALLAGPYVRLNNHADLRIVRELWGWKLVDIINDPGRSRGDQLLRLRLGINEDEVRAAIAASELQKAP